MRKLETYVNEKLKVSTKNPLILDTDIFELSSNDEFNTYLKRVEEYLYAHAIKVPKDKSNENKINSTDLYIFVDNSYNVPSLSLGYKNRETQIFIPTGKNKVAKSDFVHKLYIGWRNYDPLFIVPNELKDDVIEIINAKV